MASKQPGTFDRAAFVAAVREAIEKAAPKNLEEAEDFKADGVKEQISGQVKEGKEGSQKDIKEATDAPPDTSKAKPKPVEPLRDEPVGQAPAAVGAASAMPPPAPAPTTDLSAGPQSVDAKMAEAEVTDEQIQKSNEPEFKSALDARDQAKEHAAAAPADYRKDEQGILGKAKGDAAGLEAQGLQQMHGARGQAFAQAVGHKQGAKSADEAKRAKVATDIQGIYDRTKADVTKTLDGLDGKVDAAFTQGEGQARKRFEDHVGAQMDAYKEERYSGLLGKGRWLKDKLAGMPSEVNRFYTEGKTRYLADMDGVIGRIADIVGTGLNAARVRIAQGKAEITKYVAQLPQDLKQVGKEAEDKLASQFEQLESDVDAKQSELVDTLARKYVESRDALDARIDEMKAANRGLVDKAIDAVVGVVKTILQLKTMLLGVLAKAADVIGLILQDPIGFLGNLIRGITAGLTQFVGNIATHLQQGLMGWLTGALGNAGIELPKTFDLKGIFGLVMQLLGLTYRTIRARVVKLVGEKVMGRLEQSVDVFKVLMSEGVGGLWRFVSDRLGDLEETVLGGIKTFIIEKVIKAGITWLIAFMNPAAAFIKACKAIYDIVMFIIERGSEIMSFVGSILDSIGAIATGSIGVVIDKVEQSLAKALPLAISFLASLLGLGGISDKVRTIIQKVKAPIDKAIDFVVMGAVKGAKKLFGWAKGKAKSVKDRFTGKGADAAPEPEPSPTQHGGAKPLTQNVTAHARHQAHRRIRARTARDDGLTQGRPDQQGPATRNALKNQDPFPTDQDRGARDDDRRRSRPSDEAARKADLAVKRTGTEGAGQDVAARGDGRPDRRDRRPTAIASTARTSIARSRRRHRRSSCWRVAHNMSPSEYSAPSTGRARTRPSADQEQQEQRSSQFLCAMTEERVDGVARRRRCSPARSAGVEPVARSHAYKTYGFRSATRRARRSTLLRAEISAEGASSRTRSPPSDDRRRPRRAADPGGWTVATQPFVEIDDPRRLTDEERRRAPRAGPAVAREARPTRSILDWAGPRTATRGRYRCSVVAGDRGTTRRARSSTERGVMRDAIDVRRWSSLDERRTSTSLQTLLEAP